MDSRISSGEATSRTALTRKPTEVSLRESQPNKECDSSKKNSAPLVLEVKSMIANLRTETKKLLKPSPQMWASFKICTLPRLAKNRAVFQRRVVMSG